MSLDEVKSLIAQGEYKQAYDICNELILSGPISIEALLLHNETFLYTLDPEYLINESDRKQAYDVFANMCSAILKLAFTKEKFFEIYSETNGQLCQWERKSIIDVLTKAIDEKEHNKAAVNCANVKCGISWFNLMLSQVLFKKDPQVIKLAESEGLTVSEFFKKYEENLISFFEHPKHLHDDELFGYKINAGNIMLKKAKNNIDAAGRCSQEYVKSYTNDTLYLLGGAELLCSLSENAKITNETKVKVFELKAQVLKYSLEANFLYNGNRLYLYSLNDLERRQEIQNNLKDTYNKLTELVPDYQVPQLPTVNPQTSSGGCYVATAVYGSYDCPQVWTLRRYRDYTLAETWHGRTFIKSYYLISPTIVKWFGHTKWFKKMWKGKLDRVVAKLQANGVESTPYEDKEW
ncbi:MAG: hypothetical protein IJD00_06025 [Clostridia bacterium]|nr:hypothetical protein [Clostridia bacterium]